MDHRTFEHRAAGRLLARHTRSGLLILATALGGALSALVMLNAGEHPAGAASTVSCSASPGSLAVTVAVGASQDGLVVTTSGGTYLISIDGTPMCTDQGYSDATYPTVTVTESSPTMPTTFAPGTDSGVHFVCQTCGASSLDLSREGGPAADLVVAPGADSEASPGTVTGISSGGAALSDSFSGLLGVVGSPNGTILQPGATPLNLTYTGTGASTALDFSTVPPGSGGVDIVDNGGSGSAVTLAGGTVVFSGVARFIGTPNADIYTIDAGNATFVGGGNPSTEASFADDNMGIVFRMASSGGQEQTTVQTSNGTDILDDVGVLVGSSAGENAFVSDGLGGHTFEARGSGNVLDLGQEPSAVTVDTTGGCSPLPDCTTGLAPNSLLSGLSGAASTTDYLSGIQTFDGSPAGTRFDSNGTGGLAFNGGTGVGDTVDLSAAPAGSQIEDSGCNGTIISGSNLEAFTDIASFVGSADGETRFVASSTPVVGPGTCGATSAITVQGQGSNNTLDLSAVPTSVATPAVVSVEPSSGPSTVSTSSPLESFSDIQTVIGALGGNTSFVTGSVGGFNFAGQGGGNSLSFQEASPSGSVQVFLAPNNQNQQVAEPGTGSDTFTGISTVIGSPGANSYFGGPGNWVIRGEGHDTFSDAAAPNGVSVTVAGDQATVTGGFGGQTTTTGVTTFVGSAAGGNSFAAGPNGGYVFQAPSGTSDNSLSLAGAGSGGLSVTVTSATGDGVASGLVPGGAGATQDTFAGIQDFQGSPGDDSFQVGAGEFVLSGGGGNDSLDLTGVPTGVTVNLSGSVGSVTSGTDTVSDAIIGFDRFTGSAAGGNTFVASPEGGYRFIGAGSGNRLDLGAAPAGATVTLTPGSAQDGTVANLSPGTAGSTMDTFSDIQDLPGAGSYFKYTQALTFISVPPNPGVAGNTYAVAATGGGSGNPVTFALDPSGTPGACSLSGAVVSFLSAGTCVIDAGQAGSSSYTAAPTVSQTVTVVTVVVSRTRTGPLTLAPGQDGIVLPGGTVSGPVNIEPNASLLLEGSVHGPVTVAPGGHLVSSGGSVSGPITVGSGASLSITGTKVSGPVSVTRATDVLVCGATIAGPLTVTGSTGAVVVGDPGGSAPCAGNLLGGPVRLTGNLDGVVFDGNNVSGPTTITGNDGSVQTVGDKSSSP